ncbi:MAG TPA: hypothetical protein VMI31_03165, partial [Fimbriimonadaceae bacterium]|nr:hypothetical protein [Fimbriimonadaceae bacterium]
MATVTAIVFSSQRLPLPEPVRRWLDGLAVSVVETSNPDEVMDYALRSRPRVVVFDARCGDLSALDLIGRLKADSYTAVLPAIALVDDGDPTLDAAFRAGADEVVSGQTSAAEVTTRLKAVLTRSDRDLYVHPSTRLPGAVEIEAEIGRRLLSEAYFATCYADL